MDFLILLTIGGFQKYLAIFFWNLVASFGYYLREGRGLRAGFPLTKKATKSFAPLYALLRFG